MPGIRETESECDDFIGGWIALDGQRFKTAPHNARTTALAAAPIAHARSQASGVASSRLGHGFRNQAKGLLVWEIPFELIDTPEVQDL